MNIKDKTLDEVSAEVSKLLSVFNPEQKYSETALQAIVDQETTIALTGLLSIRGQLIERFKGVFNVIESIENGIKAKSLPVGTYGVAYPLKVTMVQKTVVYEDKIVDAIKAAELNIQDYMVLDLKNDYVVDLVKKNKNFSAKVPNYNKHTFG